MTRKPSRHRLICYDSYIKTLMISVSSLLSYTFTLLSITTQESAQALDDAGYAPRCEWDERREKSSQQRPRSRFTDHSSPIHADISVPRQYQATEHSLSQPYEAKYITSSFFVNQCGFQTHPSSRSTSKAYITLAFVQRCPAYRTTLSGMHELGMYAVGETDRVRAMNMELWELEVETRRRTSDG